VGVTPLNFTLGRCPNGIFATCKRGEFVLQRATEPAKELIAQRKQAGLITRQGARQGAKMAKNAKCSSLVAMILGRAR